HRHRNWSAQDAHLFQRLASHILYATSTLRADPTILAENRKGQPGLWAYGISGDKPIALAFVADFDEVALASQLLVAHTYLRPGPCRRPSSFRSRPQTMAKCRRSRRPSCCSRTGSAASRRTGSNTGC